jgi:hypothetical protein
MSRKTCPIRQAVRWLVNTTLMDIEEIVVLVDQARAAHRIGAQDLVVVAVDGIGGGLEIGASGWQPSRNPLGVARAILSGL